MKTEELLAIGLTEEQASKVFAMNGADIEREKAKTTQAKADLADAQQKLADSTKELEDLKKTNGDVAAVQKKLDELQAKYDTDTQALQGQLAERDYTDAIGKAIAGANEGKGLKFSSKAARTAFEEAIREKKLELKDGALTGFDEFVKAQKEADPDAFASDKPAARFAAPVGVGNKPNTESLGAMYAKQFNAQYAQTPKKE